MERLEIIEQIEQLKRGGDQFHIMNEEKKKKLRRLCLMASSLVYACDELMGEMERESCFGKDEATYVMIDKHAQDIERYRNELEDLLDE